MSCEKTAIPEDLLQLSQRLTEWRSTNPPRTRLPETIWEAAAEMAQRHGLHCTTKALRMDYTRLKKRLPACTQTLRPEPPAFLELLAPPSTGSMEYVVEWESARGRMRVATKRLSKGRFRWWPEGETSQELQAHQAQLLFAAGNPDLAAAPVWRNQLRPSRWARAACRG